MRTAALAFVSILLSVAAQFALKAGMSVTAIGSTDSSVSRVVSNPWIWLGFAAYGLGAVIWLGVLSKWDVSKAYPLAGGGFAVTLLIGYFIGEDVTAVRIVGDAVICIGIAVVSST